MLVSEETGALKSVYMLRWTRSVPEVRGRFQSRLRSLYYLWWNHRLRNRDWKRPRTSDTLLVHLNLTSIACSAPISSETSM